MAGFTKLFLEILDSTIWRESLPTKVVWITMLAKASKNGVVSASIPGLADAARVSLEECEAALQKFQSPDPYSRTKDFEGRRIMETDGGWILLNYLKYRKIQDEDAVREATAARVRKFREKHNVTHVTEVTPGNAIAEAEAEAEKELQEQPLPPPASAVLPLRPKGAKKAKRVQTTALRGSDSEEAFRAAWDAFPRTRRAWSDTLKEFEDVPVDPGSRLEAERNFQAIVDAGICKPNLLYYALFAYLQEEPKVKKGFIQRVSTFFGPQKGTYLVWLDRAKALREQAFGVAK